MQRGTGPKRIGIPWYLWPLVLPVAIVAWLVVGIPLAVLALISIPLTWLYPDRHTQHADVQGTPEEKARVARWRAAYDRLSITGRVRRAVKLSARRRARRRR